MINRITEDLQPKKQKLNAEKKSLNQIAKRVILNQIDENHSSELILENKALIKAVSIKLTENKILFNEIETLEKEYRSLNQRLTGLKDMQYALLDLLRDLEDKKITVANKYIEIKSSKNKYHSIIEKQKLKKRLASRKKGVEFKLRSPLDSFSNTESGKKGINFEFKDITPVFSSNKGVISYVGRLANYGKVVMIDHGKDIRSVYLGQFNPKVKQGMKVKSGQILGYTDLGNSEKANLYFEVRKKDIAQKTIDWLDEKSLTKKI